MKKKRWGKRLLSLALCGTLLLPAAGAVTPEGDSETWFDGVWALIDTFGLGAEDNAYVLQNYINQYIAEHPEEMYNVFNAILSQLDTHSMYLSAEQYSEGFSSLEGYVGVGVGLEDVAGGVQISEVNPYSAAAEAGLQIGDRIVTVDGEDAATMTRADIAERLRGKEGTSVTMTVQRQGRTLSVTCTRRVVNQVYVSGKTLGDGVEYIKIAAMGSQNDWNAFSEIWQGLDEKNTRAVILDLRGNGGGVIDVAMKMADAMTEQKDAYLAGVRWRKDMGGLEQTHSSGGGLPLNKIVVLTDEGTASAAELLAGSLRDVNDALLIGQKTHGKWQGQFHIDLVSGDKLVITTLEMELPKTGKYEGVGLTPNIVIENKQVTVKAAALTPLDTAKTLRFGETGDGVYALTERLALLGLLDEARETFDSETLDAVDAFLTSYEMPSSLVAEPAMLAALDEAMHTLNGQTIALDTQLQTALAICKLAAEKPQRYTPRADGSWKPAS